jgi:hypothetical protein
MKISRRELTCCALAASVAAVTSAHAEPPAPAPQTAPATAPKPPEVFCNTMQAGTLCPTGTVGVLKLSGAKAAAWLEAVDRYNKTVMNASAQFRSETRGLLTAEQLAEIDRWFKQGLNLEINRALASTSRKPA